VREACYQTSRATTNNGASFPSDQSDSILLLRLLIVNVSHTRNRAHGQRHHRGPKKKKISTGESTRCRSIAAWLHEWSKRWSNWSSMQSQSNNSTRKEKKAAGTHPNSALIRCQWNLQAREVVVAVGRTWRFPFVEVWQCLLAVWRCVRPLVVDRDWIQWSPLPFPFWWSCGSRRWLKVVHVVALRGVVAAGLTNSTHSVEIRWNSRIQAGPNSKITENTVHCFKISEKIKISKKICKKTRLNSKFFGEEIFVKFGRLGW
jgi:hypothetical protein